MGILEPSRPLDPALPALGDWVTSEQLAELWSHGGGGGDSAGPRTPITPPPPLGAFGRQLVAKGVALRRPWAPKAPDAP